MRFTLASAAAVLAFTASAIAAPAADGLKKDKWYIQSSDGDFFTTSLTINGFYHYPMLAEQEHALPVRVVGGLGGNLQVDLTDIVGESATASLTLEEHSVFFGLNTAYFGDADAVLPTAGFNFKNGTVTLDHEHFMGWYACDAGLGYKQLYWSSFANETEPITTCSPVTLNAIWSK